MLDPSLFPLRLRKNFSNALPPFPFRGGRHMVVLWTGTASLRFPKTVHRKADEKEEIKRQEGGKRGVASRQKKFHYTRMELLELLWHS